MNAPAAIFAAAAREGRREARAAEAARGPTGSQVPLAALYSHSIVPGGLLGDVEHHAVHFADLVDHPRRDLLEQVVAAAPSRRSSRRRTSPGSRPRSRRCARRPARRPCGCPEARRTTATARGTGRPCGSRPGGCGQRCAACPAAPWSPRRRPRGSPGLDPGTAAATKALGQPELGPDGAHLVLEQRPQRLHEPELEVLGQAADVVVRLDRRRAGYRRRTRSHPSTACPAPDSGRRRSWPLPPRTRG